MLLYAIVGYCNEELYKIFIEYTNNNNIIM